MGKDKKPPLEEYWDEGPLVRKKRREIGNIFTSKEGKSEIPSLKSAPT